MASLDLIRHSDVVPTAGMFASAHGTPIVIDTTTGKLYTLTAAGVVTEIGTSTGTVSASPVVLYADAEPGDDIAFGPRGATGATGTTGSQGPVGPAVFLEAESGDEGPMGPTGLQGQTGSQGATGNTGPMGPAIFLEAEPGEDGEIGPPGNPGAAPPLLVSSLTPGSTTVSTNKLVLHRDRVICGSSDRLALEGTARTCLEDTRANASGLQGEIAPMGLCIVGTPKAPILSFMVPTDYQHEVLNRLNLTGVMRMDLRGNADVYLTNDAITGGRLTLTGMGARRNG